jgi:hypothetical protein
MYPFLDELKSYSDKALWQCSVEGLGPVMPTTWVPPCEVVVAGLWSCAKSTTQPARTGVTRTLSRSSTLDELVADSDMRQMSRRMIKLARFCVKR